MLVAKVKGALLLKFCDEEIQPSAVRSMPSCAETSVTAFAFDGAHPGVVYAGASGSGVFYSTDDGVTWRGLRDGLTFGPVASLALSADGSVLYAGTQGRAVFRLGTP